jgi:hypothetical protein
VLVYDEAQRAYDRAMVATKHPDLAEDARSEPELFVDFAERIPEWCVVLGLIGSGQGIHVGEEAGLIQWRWAVERAGHPDDWTIHAPLAVAETFEGGAVPLDLRPSLNLDTELRFHSAQHLHRFVADLLAARPADGLKLLADQLEKEGFHLRITRSLETGKAYLRERYAEDRDARFGLIASSKDRDLVRFGVPNDFQSTKRVRVGPWYGDAEEDYAGRSCRRLETCVTEFGAQGLELDATLLAWGTDLVIKEGRWTNEHARGYLKRAQVRDPFQLRVNAYRVLLTRGRDGCVVFVPPLSALDETFHYLQAAGFKTLETDTQ